jgi:hypothetical protein
MEHLDAQQEGTDLDRALARAIRQLIAESRDAEDAEDTSAPAA